jgi:hypothetical protein
LSLSSSLLLIQEDDRRKIVGDRNSTERKDACKTEGNDEESYSGRKGKEENYGGGNKSRYCNDGGYTGGLMRKV